MSSNVSNGARSDAQNEKILKKFKTEKYSKMDITPKPAYNYNDKTHNPCHISSSLKNEIKSGERLFIYKYSHLNPTKKDLKLILKKYMKKEENTTLFQNISLRDMERVLEKFHITKPENTTRFESSFKLTREERLYYDIKEELTEKMQRRKLACRIRYAMSIYHQCYISLLRMIILLFRWAGNNDI